MIYSKNGYLVYGTLYANVSSALNMLNTNNESDVRVCLLPSDVCSVPIGVWKYGK